MQEVPVAVTFGFKIEDANTGEVLAVRNDTVALVLRLPVPAPADLEQTREALLQLEHRIIQQREWLEYEMKNPVSDPGSPGPGEATSASPPTEGDAGSASGSSS